MSTRNVGGGQYGSGAAALQVTQVDDLMPQAMLFKQFSATGVTAAVTMPAGVSQASLMAVANGSPTSATVVVQGSNDGGNSWSNIPAGNQPPGAARYTQVRLNCTALAGGTSPTLTVAALVSP